MQLKLVRNMMCILAERASDKRFKCVGFGQVAAKTNDKSSEISEAASSAKKEILSGVHTEAKDSGAFKTMLVYFEKFIRVLIYFSVVMSDSKEEMC